MDAGSTLLGQPVSDRSQGKPLVEAMNAMGYNAMSLGRFDLKLGTEVLLERAKDANFAILSSNVRTPDGRNLLPSYYLLEVGGRKVGLFGLTAHMDVTSATKPLDLYPTDPVQAAREVVAILQEKTDIIIALSHLGRDTDNKVAAQVVGIDIIVGAMVYEPISQAVVNPQTGTILVYPGAQGEHLGVLKVGIDSSGKIVEHEWNPIALTDKFADDPAMVKLVEKANAVK